MKLITAFVCVAALASCAFAGSEPSRPPVKVQPPEARGFHFVAIGDWGTGWEPQYALADKMCELRRKKPFDLVVTAGDNIYETGHPDAFKPKFYDPFACLLDAGVRFRSTLGNHDIQTRDGRPELNERRFGMKSRNYLVRKEGVRFVMWDSNRMNRDRLRELLVTEEGDRWKIVVFHHTVYSSSDDHEHIAGRAPLRRMFRKKGVDLVINGHNHIYAVTKPIDEIRYVTTGGGSASPHSCQRKWFTARCIVRYHFLSIVAGEDEIDVTAIADNGETIHHFVTSGRE